MDTRVLGLVISGEEALQKVSEWRPDLVLMDVYLAGELQFAEGLRPRRRGLVRDLAQHYIRSETSPNISPTETRPT